MVNGKNKGNSFERKIYKELRELGKCQRTLGSGSSDEIADIYFQPKGHLDTFAIECKHYKQLSWYTKLKFWTKLNGEIKQKWLKGPFKEPLPAIISRQNFDIIKVMFLHDDLLVECDYEDWKREVCK